MQQEAGARFVTVFRAEAAQVRGVGQARSRSTYQTREGFHGVNDNHS